MDSSHGEDEQGQPCSLDRQVTVQAEKMNRG
jgi:hypothetical protein